MISMLIYSCKQNEIELLQEISKDMVAYLYDEQLEIITANHRKNLVFKEIDNIDIAFIDITEKSGLQIAKELRSCFSKTEIMIISDKTISPIVYLIPEIRAASLLLKPLKYSESQKGIRELFSLLEQNMKNDKEFFLFEDDKKQRRVSFSQILYFEARNGRVYIGLRSKEYGIYATIEALEQQLPEDFKRCHRGFIVNVSYISEVWYSKNYIVLDNNIRIPLSRSYKSVIKEVVKNGG